MAPVSCKAIRTFWEISRVYGKPHLPPQMVVRQNVAQIELGNPIQKVARVDVSIGRNSEIESSCWAPPPGNASSCAVKQRQKEILEVNVDECMALTYYRLEPPIDSVDVEAKKAIKMSIIEWA